MTAYIVRPRGNRWQVVALHDGGQETPVWPTKPTERSAKKRAEMMNRWQHDLAVEAERIERSGRTLGSPLEAGRRGNPWHGVAPPWPRNGANTLN